MLASNLTNNQQWQVQINKSSSIAITAYFEEVFCSEEEYFSLCCIS